MGKVKIWQEQVSIPTYGVGEKEKNPMFFEKRVYQGSTGKVYPHPVIDTIEDDKKDKSYTVVFLENEYIQVQVMPEIGGRIYRAIDKTNEYDFVYHNQVMKPALVALTGPWVSGGIEFNWPQHHRPNTFGAVEYRLDTSCDDKATVWLSETDRMYGTKVTTGISVTAGAAVIEISSELYNPTGEAQTFLWWANPAVEAHDETQSIFPPDVHAVMDHGKRAVSKFPIATGTYYNTDYSSGVDISRYKNIPVPTSYMAYHSDYNFVGSFDYRQNAGILHVADHHISPGKKQWTWGCGEFGQAWDRNLTDEDGPYVELMTGVFTDNQPDFTWLAPYSNKSFTQYFLPYKAVGEVTEASKDIVAGLQVEAGIATIKLYASRQLPEVTIVLQGKKKTYLDTQVALSPTETYEGEFEVAEPAHHLTLSVFAEGTEEVVYTPAAPQLKEVPDPAKAIGPPETLENTEALLLAGLHLEQYRHATYSPDEYYVEGLKRDPGDIRLNNAWGNLLLRRGQFDQALTCFEAARQTSLRHSPNPYDGEVFYNLGKALEYLGREDEAFDAYYKACWSDAWKSQGYLKLAQIASRRNRYSEAAAYAQESLYTGAKNFKARAALTILYRILGEKEKAQNIAQQTLVFDPLDFVALRELTLLEENPPAATQWQSVMREDPHNYMNLAQTYAELGCYQQAVIVLDNYFELTEENMPYAMCYYFRAAYLQAMESTAAETAWKQAASASSDYCFPSSLAEYQVLSQAVALNSEDAKAYYYRGCFLYDKRRHVDAQKDWEESIRWDSSFPTAHRNLSLYYANKEGNWEKAEAALTTAFTLNPTDSRILFELHELYKRVGKSLDEQKKMLETHKDLVHERDDLVVAYAEVLNGLHQYQEVLDLLMHRKFHPWEGGEGKVPTQHINARIGLARKLLKEGNAKAALDHLEKATIYYHNFGEGKLAGAQENNIYYSMGVVYRSLGQEEKAVECFETAAVGLSEPASAMYYYDQPPHMIYYQGKALEALGRPAEARSRFYKLVDYGETNVFKKQVMDYFAVSMPDFAVFETDLDEHHQTHCYYMMGLGYLGLGKPQKAKEAFDKGLTLTPCHAGLRLHKEEVIEEEK